MNKLTPIARIIKSSLLCTAIAGSAVYAQEQSNKEAKESKKLEVITVTSQKRPQSLHDVPISVSAMNGEKIEDAGIQKFEDVATYVPNFSVTRDPIGDKINIRGIESGNQAGFEQSVGTFVNGIYRGRGTQARYAFMDVEMVEVLRGPQGTLFGKNTIAGALNITTALPTEHFEAKISVAQNFTFDETEVQGYLSGSLSDNVRARLFYFDRSMKDGYIDNQYYDNSSPVTDESGGRLTLEWDASDDTKVTFFLEQGDFDVEPPHGLFESGPVLPLVGAVEGYDKANHGNASSVIDFGTGQRMIGENTESSIQVESAMGDGTLTAILGYSAYDYNRQLDVDYSSADGLGFTDSEDFSQHSLELRYASDLSSDFSYITGLFYQQQDMTVDAISQFHLEGLQPILNSVCKGVLEGALGEDAYNDNYVAGNAIATAFNIAGNTPMPASITNVCGQAAAFDGVPGGVGRYAKLEQETTTWAVFAQGTYQLSDSWNATLGLRYTEEEKAASHQVNAADWVYGEKSPTESPMVKGLAEAVGEFTTHDFSPSDPGMTRDESSLTWSANVTYHASEDIMLYGTASTGFKAGGFNSFYMGESSGKGADSEDVSFEEEEAITFELGAKMNLLDGLAEVNLAVFNTEFDDLQAAIFSGNTTFEVQNAAKATSRGIEIDARYMATDDLTLTASLGYLDFNYDDFANQACTTGQFGAARQAAYDASASTLEKVQVAFGYNNASCAAAAINDLSGKTAANAPEFSASLSANYIVEIGDFELNNNLDINYAGEQYRQADLDPIALADATTIVNASISLSQPYNNWKLSLIGKNLTDEQSFMYINDVPLFAGAHNFTQIAPRSITLRFSYIFE